MSLLMEALKKAERAKQKQTVPHAEQSGQPGGAAETPNSVAAPSPGLSLLPQEGAAGHVDTTGNSAFPSILPDLPPPPSEGQDTAPARVEPTVSALELTLDAYDLSSASADRKSESPCGEPPPPRGASVSPAPVATPLSPNSLPECYPHPNLLPGGLPSSQPSPEGRRGDGEGRLSQLGAMEKGAGFNLAASHVEAPNRAPPQDVRKIAAAQQQARTVFSAKQPARSRTMLLTGSAAAVVLGLVGFGIYYWQITSTGSMAIPASTPQPASAAAPAIPVDAGAPQQQGTPAAPAQNPIDKPVLSLAKRPAPVTVQASPPAVSTAPDPARDEARGGAESFKENPAIRIRQSAATSLLNPALGKAYQSFRSGDTETAQQLYHKVLQQEPNNRDALLGMAAIALKHKQAGQAAAYYGKLLELDPADPEALAGLIGLQGQSDPAQSESRLKKALAQNPQADVIHFALGNLYAQQSRWAEAQQSYFRAYSSAPGNADYAFNLAVSLDHLNQGKLALDYYQRALAQPGPANFDKSSVQVRIKELLQPAGN